MAAKSKPDMFRIERSTTIKAPPERIFPLIEDFRHWQSWSPYEKRDPAMTKTHSGAQSGQGAIYEWAGRKAGVGRMEILEASPPSRVLIKLDFSKPMKAHNHAEFMLGPQADSTRVTWAMYGPKTLLSNIMGMFFSMDKLVGKDFEKGLANLKALTEP